MEHAMNRFVGGNMMIQCVKETITSGCLDYPVFSYLFCFVLVKNLEDQHNVCVSYE